MVVNLAKEYQPIQNSSLGFSDGTLQLSNSTRLLLVETLKWRLFIRLTLVA